ncbi:hypothetical protein LPJ76_005296 [Coemansia sp. RSA 638]|nr:hypothetical protein LPJ76_005296 [Coemansia sp. RSA 638]
MALSLTSTLRVGHLATRQPANWRAVSSTANARVQLASVLSGVQLTQPMLSDLRLQIRALTCSAISNYRVPGGSGASMVGSSVHNLRGYSTKKTSSVTLSQSELSRSIEKLGAERDWEGVWKLIDDAWTSTTTEPDTASMQQLIEYALAKKNGCQAVKLAQKLWTITSRNRLAANAITNEWIDTVLCSAVSLTSGLASSKNHPFVDFTFALFLIDVTPGGPRLDREQSRVLRCANRLLASNSVRGAGSIKAELNTVTAKYVVPLKTDSEQSVQGPKWTRSRLKHGKDLPYPELKKWYIDAIARFEIPTIKNLSQLLTKAQKHGDHEFWETAICQDFPKLMSGLESTGLVKTDRLFKYYKKVVWSLVISTYASRKEFDKDSERANGAFGNSSACKLEGCVFNCECACAIGVSTISNYRVPGGSSASMVGSSVNHSRGYSKKALPVTMSQSELSRSIEKLGAERDWESVWKLIDDAWAATTTEPDTASMQQLIEHALAKKDGRQAVKLAQKLSSIISRNRLAANAITDEWIDTVLCSAVSLTSGLESSKNHPFVDFTFALFLIDVTPGEPRLDREQSRVLRCVNRLLASNSVRGAAGIKAELNAVTDKYVVPLETDSKQSAQGPKWTHSRLKHGDKLPYPELKKWYIDAVARFEIPTIKNISQLLTKAQKHGDHEFWEAVVCQDFPKLMSGLESTGLAKTDRLFKYYKKVVWSLAISTYASRKEFDKLIAQN